MQLEKHFPNIIFVLNIMTRNLKARYFQDMREDGEEGDTTQ